MIDFRGRWIVLDIEGTTSSISFVHQVLFPFARARAAEFLASRWDEPDVRAACEQIACDDGSPSLNDWPVNSESSPTQGPAVSTSKISADTPAHLRAALVEHIHRLIDEDRKLTGLKQLQGLIWREGYAAGQLRSHVYPDVPPALRRWRSAGRRLAIYSSGSVEAQKQFFAHTDFGDLLPNFSAHFDTTTGPKRESESYRRIAAALETPPAETLFLSDTAAELDAAREAKFQVGLVIRDDVPAEHSPEHPYIQSFEELR